MPYVYTETIILYFHGYQGQLPMDKTCIGLDKH